MIYLVLKAVHLAAVVTFVGGLLLSSVAVRIANLAVHRAVRRWDRTVTAPALAIVWIAGIALALSGHWFGAAWLSAKSLQKLARPARMTQETGKAGSGSKAA